LLVIVAPLRASRIARCLIWLNVYRPWFPENPLKIRSGHGEAVSSPWPGTAPVLLAAIAPRRGRVRHCAMMVAGVSLAPLKRDRPR